MILENFKFIDLTQTIHPDIPTWEGSCGFHAELLVDYPQGYRLQRFEMRAGIGTHIDAPSHFIEHGLDIASIPLENLVVPAHVVNVASKCDSNLMVEPSDIETYENTYGQISKNSLVIFYTGWSRYWNDPLRYRNVGKSGTPQYPQISTETAELLVQRHIAGIAIDTLGPECSDPTFPVHHILLGHGKYIIENIANVDLLPAIGSHVIALPPKIMNGTEATLRVIGLT